jgi:hypothetical protein
VPESRTEITAARNGDWEIYLTESKPVPNVWFTDIKETRILCLTYGSGQ